MTFVVMVRMGMVTATYEADVPFTNCHLGFAALQRSAAKLPKSALIKRKACRRGDAA